MCCLEQLASPPPWVAMFFHYKARNALDYLNCNIKNSIKMALRP